jgi:hypothetical protein
MFEKKTSDVIDSLWTNKNRRNTPPVMKDISYLFSLLRES